MSHFEIFGVFLVLNLILLLVLTVHVIRGRFASKVSYGDGGSADLIKRVRAHGNFVEYAPFHLFVLISMMQLRTTSLMMYVIGGMFIIGRALHGFGMTRANDVNPARQGGMMLTLFSFLISIIYLIILLAQSFGSYGVS